MNEVVIIAALCSMKSTIFQEHSSMEAVAGIAHAKFANAPSDHLRLLNAYIQYRRVAALKAAAEDETAKEEADEILEVWCKLHFLNLGALRTANYLIYQIRKRIEASKAFDSPSDSNKITLPQIIDAEASKEIRILKAITRGFCHQIALHQGIGDTYCTVETNVTALLHDKSALVGVRPQWVVYTQLSRRSRRQYLDNVSIVDADWLLVSQKYHEI